MAERKALKLAVVSVVRSDDAKPTPPREHASTQARNKRSRWGIAGFILHGVVFGSLAMISVVHFGFPFLFISTLIGAISLFSLFEAYAMIATYRPRSRRPNP